MLIVVHLSCVQVLVLQHEDLMAVLRRPAFERLRPPEDDFNTIAQADKALVRRQHRAARHLLVHEPLATCSRRDLRLTTSAGTEHSLFPSVLPSWSDVEAACAAACGGRGGQVRTRIAYAATMDKYRKLQSTFMKVRHRHGCHAHVIAHKTLGMAATHTSGRADTRALPCPCHIAHRAPMPRDVHRRLR